jgi:hypothetical protein
MFRAVWRINVVHIALIFKGNKMLFVGRVGAPFILNIAAYNYPKALCFKGFWRMFHNIGEHAIPPKNMINGGIVGGATPKQERWYPQWHFLI